MTSRSETNAHGTSDKPDSRGGGIFAALGRVVVHHPWRVIAVWIIAAFAVIATAPSLPTTSNESSFLPRSYESIQASNLQARAFPQSSNDLWNWRSSKA